MIFKQLEIKFPQRSIKMSIQENTNYPEAVNYLKKKQAKKRTGLAKRYSPEVRDALVLAGKVARFQKVELGQL